MCNIGIESLTDDRRARAHQAGSRELTARTELVQHRRRFTRPLLELRQ
jgi:hypothetical protein